jgi:hypothetical protein
MTLIVNLFGAPSAGKSTISAGVFYKLKQRGVSVEIISEVAKEVVWRNDLPLLKNQAYLFGEQNRRQSIMVGKVDFLITDSPLPLSVIYAHEGYPKSLEPFVIDVFKSYNNISFFINLGEHFEERGRVHGRSEALVKQEQIKNLLQTHDIHYDVITANDSGVDHIVECLLRGRHGTE